jgi:hypothetical protein
MTGIVRAMLVVVSCLAAAARAQAGTLEIFEASVGIGQVRAISEPVTNALNDVDYAPATAEGGKLFGMSELEIEVTGNLVLTPVGFTCQAVSCLYSPLPFVAGRKIQITAGNDLMGETASTTNLFRFGLTGSSGYVVATRGEYLDGTGPGGSVGAVQTIDVTILVTVPEAELAPGLAAACALLALATRTARRGGRWRPNA